MITREQIRELANFESQEGCALSFYFQPATPQNKSHREEAILVKDLVRDALREAERNGRNGCARADLEKVMDLAERLHGNGGRAKAVFACGKQNFWREYDLPPRLASTYLKVYRRFQLRPLTAIADVLPRVSIALLDRTKARFFELWGGEIRELEGFTSELPRRGRSDGFAGYDAGHAERHVENEAMQHFKRAADKLREQQEAGFERFIIGCRDEAWSEVEPHLHSYVKQRLVKRLAIDPRVATAEQVRSQTEQILEEFRSNRRKDLLREVMGQAQRNGRGAIGLRHVLQSLEKGEVQTLLLGRTFAAPAVLCPNCRHLDSRVVKHCAVCGKETVELDDASDALLRIAVRNALEIVHVPPGDAEFDRAGVAALLRFRADQNTEEKKAG